MPSPEVKMQSKPISTIKLALYGFLTWAVPFAVAVPLMGRDGQPLLPIGVFKSLMVVVGSAVGAWLRVLSGSGPCSAMPGSLRFALAWD